MFLVSVFVFLSFVCFCITPVLLLHTAEDTVKLLSRPGSHIILVFNPQCRCKIPRGTPSAGCKIDGVGKILRFSTEIAVYLIPVLGLWAELILPELKLMMIMMMMIMIML